MAQGERSGGGTKRILSDSFSGQGRDIEEKNGRRAGSVNVIRDNRKAGNVHSAGRDDMNVLRDRSGNMGKPGNGTAGRGSQRGRNVKSAGESRRGGYADNGKNGHRGGYADNGKNSSKVHGSGGVKGGRKTQNAGKSGSGNGGHQSIPKTHSRAAKAAPGSPAPPKRGQRPKKKKSGRKFLAGLLCGIIILCGLGYLVIVLFEVEQIVVTGNQYCSEEEIIDWLKQDRYSDNSLYLLWKYNQNDVEQLPAVEEAKVGLKDLRTVVVQVKEKTFSGRVDYDGRFLYFEQDGKAALITDAVIEGVPYIEGMEISADKITLGKALPDEEGQVYEKIKELIPLLEKQGLSPDKISCAGTDLTLHFGGVRVQIGSGKFSDRLAQVPPILEKMAELYADQTGVLHLENYDVSGSSIRFVPDTAAGSAGADAPPPEEGEEGTAAP